MNVSSKQLIDAFAQDLSHTLRGVRKSPAFSALVITTLGLGIGANTAMFGVVDRLMFRPYAYLENPETVHRVYFRYYERAGLRTDPSFEYTRYVDVKKWTTSFSQYAAFANLIEAVGSGDASRERQVAQVSASFWDFFRARPALGRFFTASEDVTPRGADVAVLGYGFWKSEFGGRDVRGEILHVGNVRATIIGVAPEGFSGVSDADPPAVYVPITTYAGSQTSQIPVADYYTKYDWGWMQIVVRRKAGVSVDVASADASQAYRKSWEASRLDDPSMPSTEIAKPFAVVSAMKSGAGPDPGLEARTALWLTGVAVMVLLIACANVANLFLARSLKRRRETAVRLALGVSRGRLTMQLLTESVVLALLGGVAGLFVAKWGGAAIRRILITTQGASLDVFTDWRTLAVAIGVALVAAVATGLVPALLSGGGDLATSLKAGTREGTYQRSRTRAALVVLQGAMSVALMVGAGLFMRSLHNVTQMRMGYDAERVLQVRRALRGMPLDDSARAQLHRRLLATAQSIPGVEYAAFVTSIPFQSTSSTSLYVAGIDSVRRLGNFSYQTATTDYFRVMGTPIVRGRGFTNEDRATAPRIAVVSEGMAQVLWPGRNAIGQCMRVRADSMPCTTVVGVAEDIVQRDVTASQRFHYYLPLDQSQPSGGAYLLLKTRGDPNAQVEHVRKALQTVMPGQSYVTVRPLSEAIDGARRSWRLGAMMFLAFGSLALVVAAIGLYGVIGYNVAQRMHELGVRVALGARANDIVTLVVSQGVRFALAGIGVGSVLALLAGRWLQPLLFQQSARDPVIYVAIAGLLLVVAIAACASPAFRATRADPNTALRAD